MRALKILAAAIAALALAALLAAWQIPPHLDWTRFRGAIATLASARMGRAVTIGGRIHLSVLPEAVLVAEQVSIADRGDGVSARIGAMRLRVALGPLLRGRLVPRRLELDGPAVSLPWPLPRGAAVAVPARVASGFSAQVEGGSLRLGGAVLTGINGGVQSDPDTGAFAAQGVSLLAGLPWRFTALIGAPGVDGISALTVTLDGQGRALGTGGTLRGRILAGGNVRGAIALRGGDLSRLMTGPAVPWRLSGPVQAAQGAVMLPQLDGQLGGSPGEGSATLLLGAAPELAATLHVGQLGLDGWAGDLMRTQAKLPMHVHVSADAGRLMGGTLRNIQAALAFGGARGTMSAQATLPGGAVLRLNGASGAPGTQDVLAGVANLEAPDLGALLAWLRPAAPAILDTLPPALLAGAKLQATLHLSQGRVRLTDLAGVVNGSALKGTASLTTGTRPSLEVALAVDRLSVPVTSGLSWQGATALPGALGNGFGQFDASVQASAAQLNLGGLVFSDALIQAEGSAGGLALRRFTGSFGGARVEASGGFARDGSIIDGKLNIAAPDEAALKWPSFWPELPAGLMHGPLALAAAASGPPHAILVQFRGDAGDLRVEAEAKADMTAPAISATITLRHPGAPRLLSEWGVATGADWLGAGAVAILTHLAATPGHLTLQDFSVAAGALRLAGQGEGDFAAAEPAFSGRLYADNLVLPAWPSGETPIPLAWLSGWQGRFDVGAAQIFAGQRLAASHAAADLTIGGGAMLADKMAANLAGGHFVGQAALDTASPYPAWTLRAGVVGAAIDQLPLPAIPPLQGGTADVVVDVTARGSSAHALGATVSGDLQGALHDVAITGIDLARLGKLLTARGKRLRASLAAALAAGDTGVLSGGFDVAVTDGTATLGSAAFTGPAGAITLGGFWNVPEGSEDLRLRAFPAVPAPPALSVRWLEGKRTIDAQPGLLWVAAGKDRTRR